MGRQREPFDPAKHMRCKCGWLYNKNLPADKPEQHNEGPHHRMLEEDERLRGSLLQHMAPLVPGPLDTWNASDQKQKEILVHQ